MTYTGFTLLSIVPCSWTSQTMSSYETPLKRFRGLEALYLTALTVLNLPELKQQVGRCDDVIGEIDIALGPEAPAKAAIAVGEIVRELKHIQDYHAAGADTEGAVALEADADWDERVALARGLVEEAAAAESPEPTIARALEIGAAATARVLKRARRLLVDRAADQAGQVAGAQFLHSVASAAAVSPAALETGTVALPWLRRNT